MTLPLIVCLLAVVSGKHSNTLLVDSLLQEHKTIKMMPWDSHSPIAVSLQVEINSPTHIHDKQDIYGLQVTFFIRWVDTRL